jgi:hypothetical protein
VCIQLQGCWDVPDEPCVGAFKIMTFQQLASAAVHGAFDHRTLTDLSVTAGVLMFEIELLAAPGIGWVKIRIGRQLWLFLSFATYSHWH